MSARPAGRVRTIVVAAFVPVALTLSACGDTSSDDASSIVRTTTNVAGAGVVGIERETAGLCAPLTPPDAVAGGEADRIVVDDGRSVTVPADPQRIVVLDLAALDASCAAGTWERVVGAPAAPGSPVAPPPEPLRPSYLGTGIAEIPSVGPLGAPDLEAVRALDPDVVIGSDAALAGLDEELASIAPTVVTRAAAPWQDSAALAAVAMGRGDGFGAALEAYRDRAAEVGQQLNAPLTQASVVRFGADGAELLGSDSFAGQVLAQAGVRRPEPQSSTTTALSEDDLSAAEGDLIYVLFDGEAGLEYGTSVMESDAWMDLGAATDARVFTVDDAVWSGNGVVAAQTVLTDLTNSLNAYV